MFDFLFCFSSESNNRERKLKTPQRTVNFRIEQIRKHEPTNRWILLDSFKAVRRGSFSEKNGSNGTWRWTESELERRYTRAFQVK